MIRCCRFLCFWREKRLGFWSWEDWVLARLINGLANNTSYPIPFQAFFSISAFTFLLSVLIKRNDFREQHENVHPSTPRRHPCFSLPPTFPQLQFSPAILTDCFPAFHHSNLNHTPPKKTLTSANTNANPTRNSIPRSLFSLDIRKSKGTCSRTRTPRLASQAQA